MAAACCFSRLFCRARSSFASLNSFVSSRLHKKVLYNQIEHLRRCSTLQDGHISDEDACSSFEKMIRERRRQIRKSILVHVYSKHVVMKLYSYCQKYGDIKRAFHYSLENDKDFALFEFENEDCLQQLLSDTKHFDRQNVIPVHSRCLWYHETDQNKEDTPVSDFLTNGPPSERDIILRLQQAESLSGQMTSLHELLKLTELGQVLRFFICHQLELAFVGLFTNCNVLPFGSSVNGFGKFNCDLDMVLSIGETVTHKEKNSSKLFFHTKCSLANTRVQVQRHLETISDVISNFFPGCSNVQRILQARVPIIKFKHELVNTECDLTMNNLSGVYMSELLYLWGESDHRVRPLVFTVLKWAKQNNLTQESPGRWITNFSLILMVIVFLQARPNPILPSIETLRSLAGKEHQRSSDGLNCTFLRDVRKFPKTSNQESLGDLLREFFYYYYKFDFKNRGLSLISGSDVAKQDFCPLYIQNPFETELNVCKNVSSDELSRIQEKLQTAIWKLETAHEPKSKKPWGLLDLFDINIDINEKSISSRLPVSAFFDKTSPQSPIIQNPKGAPIDGITNCDSLNGETGLVRIKKGRASTKKDLVSHLKFDKFLLSTATAASVKYKSSVSHLQNRGDYRQKKKARTKPWRF